jgi:hypothetical protein
MTDKKQNSDTKHSLHEKIVRLLSNHSALPDSSSDPEQNLCLKAIRKLKALGQPFDEYDVELEVEKLRSEYELELELEKELALEKEKARKEAEYEASQSQRDKNDTRTKKKGWIYVLASLIVVVMGVLIVRHYTMPIEEKVAQEEIKPPPPPPKPKVQPKPQPISNVAGSQLSGVDRSVAIQEDIKNNKFQLAVFSYDIELFLNVNWYVRTKIDLYRDKDFKEKIGSITGSFKEYSSSEEDEPFTMLENRMYYYLIPEIKIKKIDRDYLIKLYNDPDHLSSLKVGDTIRQLILEEDSWFHILHKGEVIAANYWYVDDDLSYNPKKASGDFEGDVIQENELSVFIAKIKTSDNKVGWIKLIRDDENNINEWGEYRIYRHWK